MMQYVTTIELPVQQSKQGGYVLTRDALGRLLSQLETVGNLVNIEWKDGNCFATIELLSSVSLEEESNVYNHFVTELILQTNRKNNN